MRAVARAGEAAYAGAMDAGTGSMPTDNSEESAPCGAAPRNPRAVRIWLYAIAGLVALMVLVGGTTRLTDSGLSITEWKPVTGAVPPLSAQAWAVEFEKYQAIPEYRLINRGMTLGEFKAIYWWEWGHRALGRLIGLAFALPFAVFYLTGHLRRRHLPLMAGLFILGGLQGAVGWWMVVSGLVDRVDVSQYRLAVHLVLASGIFAALLGAAATFERHRGAGEKSAVRTVASGLVALIFLQIFAGALVAGLDAGMAYNTWPLIEGRIVPDGLFVQDPGWRNLFENALTVQFMHRMLGYGVALVALWHTVQLGRGGVSGRRWGACLLPAVILQIGLGVMTLLAQVPIGLALAHQAGAIAVLGIAVMNRGAMAHWHDEVGRQQPGPR